MNRLNLLSVLFVCVSTTLGCAAKRPVLYTNDRLQEVGKETAERDIDRCFELAASQGVSSSSARKAAGRAAGGSAVAAAVGAAVGAVTGNPGRGAAAGAAGGGAGGLLHALIGSRDPDPIQRRFVEECLREKGYEPIGWQ